MALPSLADCKAYLRVETTDEDALITALLARATATATVFLDRPITAEARDYVIEDPRASSLGASFLSYDPQKPLLALRIPDSPVASNPAPVIVDRNGDTVDASMYRINHATGVVRAGQQLGGFNLFPYAVTATVGLSTRADYTALVEPAINQGIVDIVADLYERRNPAATREAAGGGEAVEYGRQEERLPLRALDMLAPFRRMTV